MRFVGVVNAAIWLGGTFFCVLQARPSLFMPAMEVLLGVGNAAHFPYIAGGAAQVVMARCFEFQIVCAVIAWLHALAEWLYLGRPPRKFAFSLLAGLLALGLIGASGVQPRLKELHRTRYRAVQPAERESATNAFRTWRLVSDGLNLLIVGGLAVYLWRVSNPPDTPRFVSSVKFRG